MTIFEHLEPPIGRGGVYFYKYKNYCVVIILRIFVSKDAARRLPFCTAIKIQELRRYKTSTGSQADLYCVFEISFLEFWCG